MSCCGAGRAGRVFGNPTGFAPAPRLDASRPTSAIKPERKQPIAPEGTAQERVTERRKKAK